MKSTLKAAVAILLEEKTKIDRALDALSTLGTKNVTRNGKHHTMSAEGRRRISLAQKARWRRQRRAA